MRSHDDANLIVRDWSPTVVCEVLGISIEAIESTLSAHHGQIMNGTREELASHLDISRRIIITALLQATEAERHLIESVTQRVLKGEQRSCNEKNSL